MKEKLHIGADPGATGAIVAPDIKMVIRFSKLTDSELWVAIHVLAETAKDSGLEAQVILEKVFARPTDGMATAAKFMIVFGQLRGMLIASGMRFIEITPSQWTKKLGRQDPKGTSKTIKKKRNCELAQHLYPNMKVVRETGDAFLLAEYGRRFHE